MRTILTQQLISANCFSNQISYSTGTVSWARAERAVSSLADVVAGRSQSLCSSDHEQPTAE